MYGFKITKTSRYQVGVRAVSDGRYMRKMKAGPWWFRSSAQRHADLFNRAEIQWAFNNHCSPKVYYYVEDYNEL